MMNAKEKKQRLKHLMFVTEILVYTNSPTASETPKMIGNLDGQSSSQSDNILTSWQKD